MRVVAAAVRIESPDCPLDALHTIIAAAPGGCRCRSRGRYGTWRCAWSELIRVPPVQPAERRPPPNLGDHRMKRSAPVLIAVALSAALLGTVLLPGAGARAQALEVRPSDSGTWFYINPQLALVVQPNALHEPGGAVQGHFMVRLKRGGPWHRVQTRPLPSLSPTSLSQNAASRASEPPVSARARSD